MSCEFEGRFNFGWQPAALQAVDRRSVSLPFCHAVSVAALFR